MSISISSCLHLFLKYICVHRMSYTPRRTMANIRKENKQKKSKMREHMTERYLNQTKYFCSQDVCFLSVNNHYHHLSI